MFTIGHSTRTVPEFVEILRDGEVQLVVDVRSIPRSLTNPQYNFDVLGHELRQWQIGYERIAELGGLRGPSSQVAPEVNGFWENRSFHNYADYALSNEFARGLDQLISIARDRTVAIMCAEAVWWRCHRRIIADYLLLHGKSVRHLMGKGRIEHARMTPAARNLDGKLVYPAVCGAADASRARPLVQEKEQPREVAGAEAAPARSGPAIAPSTDASA